ncbi:NTP transferase domain-containing protein [Alteraurantiacibacter aestuarii]
MHRAVAEPAPLVAVLAAGGATRFGGGKLDALCAGKPVGQWVLDAVAGAGLAAGVIVVGEDPPQFALASGWSLIVNHSAEAGLGTSLALAANHAQKADRDLLVLLADMPLITAAHLRELACQPGTSATVSGSTYAGVPALFHKCHLPQLEKSCGDRGAAAFLTSLIDLEHVQVDPAMLIDIDTPADLARAEQILLRRG